MPFSVLSDLHSAVTNSKGNERAVFCSTEFSVTVVNGKFTWCKEDLPVLQKYVQKSRILGVFNTVNTKRKRKLWIIHYNTKSQILLT